LDIAKKEIGHLEQRIKDDLREVVRNRLTLNEKDSRYLKSEGSSNGGLSHNVSG
jgi:hypothetical protein